MTDNTPLNADDELFDTILSVLGVQDREKGNRPGQIEVMRQLVLTDRKKHELQAKVSEVRLMMSEAREAWDRNIVTNDFYERIKVYTDSRLDELKQELEKL